MKMYDVTVEVHEGEVFISQLSGNGEQDQVICLSAEQVTLICSWLYEAERTIKASKGKKE